MSGDWSTGLDRIARRAAAAIGVLVVGAVIVPVGYRAMTPAPAPRIVVPQRDRVMAEDLLRLMMREQDDKRLRQLAEVPATLPAAAEAQPVQKAPAPVAAQPARRAEAPVPVPTPRRVAVPAPVAVPAVVAEAPAVPTLPTVEVTPARETRPGVVSRAIDTVYRPVADTTRSVYRPVADTAVAATQSVRGAMDGTMQFLKERVRSPF